jgi:putative proteasome-type protease
MTYCVGVLLDAGMVFASDSRTNAGVDHVSSFRKMTVYDRPGDRVIVILSSGNLSVTQNAINLLESNAKRGDGSPNVWNAHSLFEIATLLGDCLRDVKRRDAAYLTQNNIDANANFILGGQVKGEPHRLFMLYQEGNFIEATPDTPFFQVGETKYGKPIIDRVIQPTTPLDEAAKCALISMDSTLRSNISVGLPLDLLVYEADALRVTKFVQIDSSNQYMNMIRNTWGARLKQVFTEIPDPVWRESQAPPGAPRLETEVTQPVRAPLPPTLEVDSLPASVQLVAGQVGRT